MARSPGLDPDMIAGAQGPAMIPAVVESGCGTALRRLARFCVDYPLGATGAALIAGVLLAALFAPLLAPYGPLETDYAATLSPPGAGHWLGTDAFGRDLLSRLIYGSRTALLVAVLSSFLAATGGALIGTVSAYAGGHVDLWLQRVLDVFLSFPFILLALAVVTLLGTGTVNVIIAITVPATPSCARIIRSSALLVRGMAYVEAARASGSGHARIVLRHMLPNVVTPYLVVLTGLVGHAMLLEASLSYLGLGVAEPHPAWGLMLRGAAVEFAESAPWMAVFPGVAIFLAVAAFNLLGDALRDAFDPRLRA